MSQRATRNRTLTLSEDELSRLRPALLHLDKPASLETVLDQVVCQDMAAASPYLPAASADVLLLDPPYNLDKTFGSERFRQRSPAAYVAWAEDWLTPLLRLLKPTASVYVCADWRTSAALFPLLERHFIVRNRITWERDKGRGARTNWKQNAEDIWFCTVGDSYTFNVDAVKLKRRVRAPYRDPERQPKDWIEEQGERYRLTHPSNLWTDITVPFWSMPENTDHPTQKPEKLVARLLLASSNAGDVVLDPFLGSGTTAVVARKLGRRFIGIEIDPHYACLALKRLALAHEDKSIQGYRDGVFFERNS
ncbi:MAG: site-specific DNA-methyltransferase [Chloroflexota bacterium]|nr:site-specific DNA-methyltransferase [Chloroflexota bacterium]